MKSSLLAIQRELRLQGDWLEVIATNDFFAQVPSSESTAGQEAVEDYWCPNCRDKFEADIGSVGQCPKCKRIGHLYES